MAKINQFRITSGCDVEALLGEHYLQILFQTALVFRDESGGLD
jgi:hypothetical protein